MAREPARPRPPRALRVSPSPPESGAFAPAPTAATSAATASPSARGLELPCAAPDQRSFGTQHGGLPRAVGKRVLPERRSPRDPGRRNVRPPRQWRPLSQRSPAPPVESCASAPTIEPIPNKTAVAIRPREAACLPAVPDQGHSTGPLPQKTERADGEQAPVRPENSAVSGRRAYLQTSLSARKLDPPIDRSTRAGFVRHQRLALTSAAHVHSGQRDAPFREVLSDRLRTPQRESEIVFVGTRAVGVAHHPNEEIGIRREHALHAHQLRRSVIPNV